MKPKAFQTDKGVTRLALRAGVSTSTVSRKLRQGKSPDQIIAESEAWKEQQRRQAAAPTDNEELAEARTRKEIALANLMELQLDAKRAELVPPGEVNAWIAQMIDRANGLLLPIGTALRNRIAQEKDPAVVQKLIDAEIHRALRELAAITQ